MTTDQWLDAHREHGDLEQHQEPDAASGTTAYYLVCQCGQRHRITPRPIPRTGPHGDQVINL